MKKRKFFLNRWWNNFVTSRFYIKFWRFWRIYFRLSRIELRGFILLLLILFLVVVADQLNVQADINRPKIVTDTTFFTEIDSFFKSLEPKTKKSFDERLDEYIKKRYDTIELFTFDPNTVSVEQMQKLGFTQKQIQNLINYRRAGGKFHVKSDLKRLYSIRATQYEILEPYIDLPDKKEPKFKKNQDKEYRSKNKSRRPSELFAFDPNTISKDSLILLGFSPRQAQSIIKARSRGWKFKTKKDFSRLYVVSDSMFERLKDYIQLPDSLHYTKKPKKKFTKIELNTATVQQLVDIGFSESQAKAIVDFRKKLGGFCSTYQLYDVSELDRDIIKKTYWKMTVDRSKIRKINLKTVDYQTLVDFPYIDQSLAKWIVKHQKRRKFQDLSYLKRYGYLDYRLRKYLSCYFYVK